MSQKSDNKMTVGRALTAALRGDWLITEEALRNLLTIAARMNVNQAVEGYEAEPLEYTREATIRDGVAIIPVDGPIFRMANLFTYFSGGASVDVLAKDFISALENDKVSAIMFEINSPGGEVTGINEFCEMIYQARSKKPITARVGGMGCSAAYWLASACGDIAIDKTAQLGSIGVYCCYMDDRRAQAMEGIEEIEFISSQSPYKNAPPWTDEGKARIQKRIDALAGVFVETVARNRGVSVETVLSDFGQGDVFVGQAAIDAGLADRLGSFEESVYLLNVTHNPFFTPAADEPDDINEDDDPDATQRDEYSAADNSTIKEIVPVQSQSVNTETPEIEEKPGELMKENENATAPATTSADGQPNPPAANAAAAGAATPAPAAAGTPDQSAQIADLQNRLKAATDENSKLAERTAVLETAATEKWIGEQVAGFVGNIDDHKEILTALVGTHGRDGAITAKYIETQKAIAAQTETSDLFKEAGATGAGSDSGAKATAEAKADRLAKERAASDKITYEQAYKKVLEEDKALAKAILS